MRSASTASSSSAGQTPTPGPATPRSSAWHDRGRVRSRRGSRGRRSAPTRRRGWRRGNRPIVVEEARALVILDHVLGARVRRAECPEASPSKKRRLPRPIHPAIAVRNLECRGRRFNMTGDGLDRPSRPVARVPSTPGHHTHPAQQGDEILFPALPSRRHADPVPAREGHQRVACHRPPHRIAQHLCSAGTGHPRSVSTSSRDPGGCSAINCGPGRLFAAERGRELIRDGLAQERGVEAPGPSPSSGPQSREPASRRGSAAGMRVLGNAHP